MRRTDPLLKPWTRAAIAALVLLVPVLAWADDPPPPPAEAEAAVPGTVIEPFFGFLLHIMDTDTTGVWTGEQIAQFGFEQGHPSRLPVERILEIRRRRPHPVESQRWPEARLLAMWEFTLEEDIKHSMPYSILGYHPGSFFVARRLVMSELALGSMNFDTGEEEFPEGRTVSDIRALRLDSGWVVLDADYLPDKILGGALDDAWTQGFVQGWEGDERVGITVAVKRDGGTIFGQFDFREDKIMKSGSPLGSALSRFCRSWFMQPGSSPLPIWSWPDR